MFEQEKAFYQAHQAEFREKYLNKWLVIVDDNLVGAFDTTKEAFNAAIQQYEPGEFMLHKPADDGKIVDIGPIIQTRYNDGRKTPKMNATIQVSKGEPVRFSYA
jgi:hypothetical protein